MKPRYSPHVREALRASLNQWHEQLLNLTIELHFPTPESAPEKNSGYNSRLDFTRPVSHEEMATILGALRFWQSWIVNKGGIPSDFDDLFEDGTKPLTAQQINTLCESIQLCPLSEDEKHPNTDEHRAGYPAGQLVYDKKLPDLQPSNSKITKRDLLKMLSDVPDDCEINIEVGGDIHHVTGGDFVESGNASMYELTCELSEKKEEAQGSPLVDGYIEAARQEHADDDVMIEDRVVMSEGGAWVSALVRVTKPALDPDQIALIKTILNEKLARPSVKGNDKQARNWRTHLRKIFAAIEDGEIQNLTENDWVEIYYVLDMTVDAQARIACIIGPDGENMVRS